MADNPLEAFRIDRRRRGPKASAPAGVDDLPSQAEMRAMLEGIRQAVSNDLVQTLEDAARRAGATMGELMWAVAMLQARVLASAEMGDQQVWTAGRFSDLVRLALPAMMLAVERAKHAQPGTHPHDA